MASFLVPDIFPIILMVERGVHFDIMNEKKFQRVPPPMIWLIFQIFSQILGGTLDVLCFNPQHFDFILLNPPI